MLNCLYVVFCHTARSEHIKSFKGRNGIRLRVGLRQSPDVEYLLWLAVGMVSAFG